MMSAELGLAIVSAIDLGLKYGKELRKICSALSGAESEISERSLRLDNGCYRCIAQLQFLKQIQHVLDDGHRELQERTLRMLIEKLTLAKFLLRSVVTTKVGDGESGTEVLFVPKAVKYAFRKDKLDEAIDTLETWQRLSDPSWFLIFRVRDAQLENTLRLDESISSLPVPSISSIRASLHENGVDPIRVPALALPAEAISTMEITEIKLSCCTLARSFKSGRVTLYILESIKLQHPDLYQQTKRNIRDLARRLQHNEPQTFGLLSCKGFISERADLQKGSPARFTMVSRTPPGLASPRSFRDLLINTIPESLSEKFLAAQELAKAVAYVHIFGFVHKGIQPESILSFESIGDGPYSLFLVGFEDFRKEDGRTQRLGDSAIERNLYRHPSRQGMNPGSDFVMQHDIYSLGVCLLELGLWQSFVDYDLEGEHPTISPLLDVPPLASKEAVAQFILGSAKTRFIELARTQLPKYMGTRYSDIVETCLSCLDPDNNEFGEQEELEDADGVLVGVRYIEKVLHRLNQLCV